MAYDAVSSKAVVLLLLTLFLLRLWESVFALCFVVRYFMSILDCNHLDLEEKDGCFAKFVFLVSCGCCEVLPRGAMGLTAVCDCGIS